MTSLHQPAALTSACWRGPRTRARATANFLETKAADSLCSWATATDVISGLISSSGPPTDLKPACSGSQLLTGSVIQVVDVISGLISSVRTTYRPVTEWSHDVVILVIIDCAVTTMTVVELKVDKWNCCCDCMAIRCVEFCGHGLKTTVIGNSIIVWKHTGWWKTIALGKVG